MVFVQFVSSLVPRVHVLPVGPDPPGVSAQL